MTPTAIWSLAHAKTSGSGSSSARRARIAASPPADVQSASRKSTSRDASRPVDSTARAKARSARQRVGTLRGARRRSRHA